MVILLGQVGYPNGDCQAGISAEYTSDGKDLVMGTIGVKQFRGKNLYSHIHIFFDWIWRLLWAIIINNWSQRVMQHKTTNQKMVAFQPISSELQMMIFAAGVAIFPLSSGASFQVFLRLISHFPAHVFARLAPVTWVLLRIAKRASDVMTQTRLRQTNWNGG